MNAKEKIATWILGCSDMDIEYLFKDMDSDLLYEGIGFLKENDISISAGNLWTECAGLAANKVFGPQADFIDTAFNCIDSRIFIKESLSEYIESFPMKKEQFEKLMACELEIWEGY